MGMDDLFADRSADQALCDRTLGRAEIAALAKGPPGHLIGCDLDEADLSALPDAPD